MNPRDAITAYRPQAVTVAGPQQPDRAEGGGRSLLGVCWRRKWTVALVVALTLSVASAYLVAAAKVYTSRSRLFVQQNGPRLLTPVSDPSLAQSDTYLFRQSEIIKAEPILKQVLAGVMSSD